MNIEHDIRASDNQVLIAALERRAAKVVSSQMAGLNSGAHRAIKHEDALGE